MLFAIHAYESTYCGLHGIEDFAIVECKDEKEAREIAYEMSYEVIMSYASCCDNLFEEVAFILGIEFDEMNERLAAGEEIDGYEEACKDAEAEMVCFEIYELDENCGATLEYLNSLEFDEVIDRFSKG